MVNLLLQGNTNKQCLVHKHSYQYLLITFWKVILLKRFSVLFYQEYHTACSAAVIHSVFLFCIIKKNHKKQNKPTQQKQTKQNPKQTNTSVHTWFSAAKKDPIFTAFSCRNFEFLVLQCSFEGSSRQRTSQAKGLFQLKEKQSLGSWLVKVSGRPLGTGLPHSLQGQQTCYCRSKCGARASGDVDPRRERDRAAMFIRSEARRNDRKKLLKNKCNNFLMGILHNWVFIFCLI